MDKLFVIKIGGNIIDDDAKLSTFLKTLATIKESMILVHGGGKLATKLADQLNIPQQIVDGRRITDAETLKIVTMVYAGYINKTIVAQLQGNGCNAVGLCGADGNAVLAHKRIGTTLDYGFAGDVDSVNSALFNNLLAQGLTPVIAPITHDGGGQLLNTNADTMAQELARAMAAHFNVNLVYCFEKSGVLTNADDENSAISRITPASYAELKQKNIVFAGMIPKLDNAFKALNNGVKKVIIGKAENLQQLISGNSGTTLINE